MAVTQNSYTGDGSTTTYSFTFPYLKSSEIKASLNSVVTTAFTTPTATTVQFNTAPSSGDKILIYRETDSDDLTATFYAGSAIKSEDLNDNFTQNLYTTQEVSARYVSKLGGSTMTGDLLLGEDVTIKFEGATDNAYETTITIADPTADRTITFPDITGTVITTADTGTVARTMIAADAINGTKIADDAVDSEHIAADSLDTEHYAPNSVDTTALGADVVTGAQIADSVINSEHYVDGSIDREHLAADIVDGTKIADDSINSEHIAADSIDAEHYAPNSVDADALAHTSVTAGTYTATDLTVDAQGRITAASTGTIARSEIAADAIDGTKLADNAVDSEHYADGSIDHVHLANDVIDGDNIQDDVVNSEHIAAGALDNEHYAAGSITSDKLSAATVVTNSEQAAASVNDTSFFTTSAADARYFNISTGDTIKDGQTFPDNDTTIATTAAINDRIIDLVDDVGGFVPIANETSFPTANPDVNNGAGTLVSIKALASNLTSNGSGVATIANGAGSGNTVTITGLANSTTYAANFGLIVETTSTLHTYAFHRQVPIATEVSTVAGSISNINTVAGSISNVNAVAGNATNINAVAADATDIGAVAGKATEIGRLGTADAVADMAILGTTDVVADLNTLGTADIVSDMNTLATSANVTAMDNCSDDIANINTVAGSISNVNTAAGSISNINTVATNISNVNDFSDKYRVASSAPTSSLDTGDLYFDTTGNELKVYNGSAWQAGVTATGNLVSKSGDQMTGNLTFSGTQTVDGRDVSVDGTKLDGIAANANNYAISSDLLDEDDMATNSATKAASQQSIKAYVDAQDQTKLTVNSGTEVELIDTGSNAHLKISLDGSEKFRFESDGDLLIGTTSSSGTPAVGNQLVLASSGNGGMTILGGNAQDGHIFFADTDSSLQGGISYDHDGDYMYFRVNGDNERLRIDSSGHVLIANDSGRLKFGIGADLQIYHDGSNSYIADTATGALRIITDLFQVRNAANNEEIIYATADGSVQLYYDDSKKLETDSNGVNITGQLDLTSNLSILDDKVITIGSGDDLQIYHDGTNSYIKNTTNDLTIWDDSRIRVRTPSFMVNNQADNENLLVGTENGAVDLYYDNSKKFETHPNGVLITGHIYSVDDNKIQLGNDADLQIYHDGTSNIIASYEGQPIKLYNTYGVTEDMLIADPGGSVELYYDDSKKFETASTGATVTGALSATTTVSDSKGDLRSIPQNTQGSAYTLVAADAGKHILASGTITVPDSVFSAGDAVTIVNNTGSNLTITKTITTMYLATDASSANRTLAARGMATILFASGTVAYISGAGLS